MSSAYTGIYGWCARRRTVSAGALLILCCVFVFYRTAYTNPEYMKLARQKMHKLVSKTGPVCRLLESFIPTTNKPIEVLTEETFANRSQDDPALVSYVRTHFLIPPSNKSYNLRQPSKRHYSQYGQSFYAEQNFLHGMVGGFFIEVGAYDGEDMSNSLYFEKHRNWTGLLIEALPLMYGRLMSRNRKAYCISSGVSITNYSGITKFNIITPGIRRITPGAKKGGTIKMFPLYTMLLALGVHQIDFFSLDVEGDEMNVLKTIPWDKVKVRLLLVEIAVVRGGTKAVLLYLEAQGYTFLGEYRYDAWFGHRDLLQQRMDVGAFLKKNNIAKKREDVLKRKP